ncbi:uncharacterized protein RHOBADRAFT_52923 [Rhodotorula graminis WP1]|uniref:[histone H3]-trimethyl-L-lysine(4) demethylase n=1 Tax=Rhodotorula graminis (strain WP1) TaxID=578459 RepID=A0A194S933_RHOGW|nr:uncharacterized protein RHOBADRAFT_52923 [Rhodotorula graminis WP1]KPV75911.1 hypothetical protein RHOBADRAFT_52923 [Rhodotorula graminis WP1]
MASPSPAPPTFISALDIVFSDDEDSSAPPASTRMAKASSAQGGGSSTAKPTMTTGAASRMNVRASKATALAAMAAKAAAAAAAGEPAPPSSASTAATPPPVVKKEEILGAHPSKNPYRQQFTLPRAPPLDYSTLRMEAPRLPNPPPRDKPRMFELEEAPVYFPTVEEFAHPMEYIERIAPDASEFGICKIVPPEGWRPSFAIDSETFRFKTRLQQLNSMEASARASLNFLEQLYLFHRQQGSSGMTLPAFGGKPVDMWRLKREVTDLGGYHAVTHDRKWSTVGKLLGYNVALNTSVCTQLKNAYHRIILPFDEYTQRVKLAGGPAPPDPVKEAVFAAQDAKSAEMKAFANKLATSPPVGSDSLATPSSEAGPSRRADESPDKVRTASDKIQEDREFKLSTRSAKDTRTPGESCELCELDHDPDRIVLCEDCDRGYHLECLTPPLKQVPASQFYCNQCLLLNGADYGFEEGQDHSLYSFRRRADAFKRKWLQDHPLPERKGKGRAEDGPNGASADQDDVWGEQLAIEDHFEREFWRLVESPQETVEVEYGADVASTKDGAGFPNLEVHPNDPYSRDGWNLNNLPILSGSLLRYVKSDISGMTIPWIYVGMVFSTFAWHKEDHYSYSINYHHLGDTKTWYGIPGEDDEKLEAAMKLAAPELFEQQTDLMFQLVTLMSPGRLKEHDVRVYAVDQRPNEFIITFPRAYHSGFNHGFNFNEAVNFALPDWLDNGLRCVERYRDIKKNPVFSHDELLITISQWEKDPRTSRWLLAHIREMVDRELGAREVLRSSDSAPDEVVEAWDRDEEDYQCQHCKCLAYLSQVVTDDGKGVACLDHASTLPAGPKTLRVRFTDAELSQLGNRVHSRAQKAQRQPDPSTGLLVGMDAPRQSGRKRKPSQALLEAAGEDTPPAPQRVKRSGSDDDEDDDDDQGGYDEAQYDDLSRGPPAHEPLQHHVSYPQQPLQQHQQQQQQQQQHHHHQHAPMHVQYDSQGDLVVGAGAAVDLSSTHGGAPQHMSGYYHDPSAAAAAAVAAYGHGAGQGGDDIVVDSGLYTPGHSASPAPYGLQSAAPTGFSPPRAAPAARSMPSFGSHDGWSGSSGWQ